MNYFMQQELEAEFNAQFDYVREANFGMVESLSALAAEERDREYECNNDEMDAMEARQGPLYYFAPNLNDPW
jgi:hypothetical protein|tara:strand:- start:820 stop:1035 length:216 start_codon:yes stop_codon:yes gene_type:complete